MRPNAIFCLIMEIILVHLSMYTEAAQVVLDKEPPPFGHGFMCPKRWSQTLYPDRGDKTCHYFFSCYDRAGKEARREKCDNGYLFNRHISHPECTLAPFVECN